jgi:hypothetical protein
MPLRSAPVARALAAALLVAVGGASCGAAPATPAPLAPGACDPARLDACEARLAATPEPDAALVASYLAARAARDPGDPWAQLHRALANGKGAALVVTGGALDRSSARTTRIIEAPSLPTPGALAPEDLLLALARAARVPHVLWAHDGALTELFPDDPLAPFLPRLRPTLRGPVAALDARASTAAHVRAALEAASRGRYVDAAREAEALAKDPSPRARFARSLLAQAGLTLDAPEASPADIPSSATETPYAAYLAIAVARDPRKAWPERASRILAGLPEDRRDDVASLFVAPKACGAGKPPPMASAHDLVFATRLAGALAKGATRTPSELSASEWLARYEAMVGFVEKTRSAWSYLPALLAERGDATGLGPSTSAAYRRVTELGLAHIASARALEKAEPARFRAISQLGVALAPGLLADPALEKAMAALMEASVRDKLAAATEPDAILSAVAAGVIAGLSYPGPLQEAQFGALREAVTAKLRGDLLRRGGWGVAALYAIDAMVRVLVEKKPDLDFSARQIARALGDGDLPHPALAALASAGARYAALAARDRLEPGARRLPADRLAARAALREAIAGLGAPGEAPASVLDDIAELADGLVATLSAARASASASKAAARASSKAVCGEIPAIALDAKARRALARLGDVRLRVLKHPRFAKGDGLWARRARALVTVLSDAMDLAVASDTRKPPVFLVPAAEAEAAWRGALGEDAPRGARDAILHGYAVLRAFVSSTSTEAFVARSARDARGLATGLFALFTERGEATGGGALLDVIARASPSDDLATSLVGYASALHAAGRTDQADLCLLGVLVASSLARKPPPEAAIAVAEQQRSRVAWALRLARGVKAAVPDPATYADGVRHATDDACQAADAEATLSVAGAIHDFAAGRRKEARGALDAVLDHADEHGLGVPRMAFRYEEKTRSRVFSADVAVSYGSGILLSGQSFQLGLGLRSGGEPQGALSTWLVPPASSGAAEDAARYYVYAAALGAAYHLLDHDLEGATTDARRAVAALSSGVKLGPRRVRSERPASYGADAREVLVVAAQLAAEAGMPFLAGDLWTVVRQGFAETLDDRAIHTMLDRRPMGLAAIAELDPVVVRARRSLRALGDPLPCTKAKVELGGYESNLCERYPLALSLRIADALHKLPRLKRTPETSARCPAWRSLDVFLAGVGKGTYDPDAFTRAMTDLVAAGHADDAAVLLARHKKSGQCSPTILAAARKLGRTRSLGPSLRADLLSQALNCAAAAGGQEVEADVMALDAETQRLPDPSRNLGVVLSIADLASRTDRWGLLAKLVDRPDFVPRSLSVHPNAAAAALLLDHALAAIRGREVDLARTSATHRLLCQSFPAPERAEICHEIDALRAPSADRVKLAKEAVRKLVATSAAPKRAP